MPLITRLYRATRMTTLVFGPKQQPLCRTSHTALQVGNHRAPPKLAEPLDTLVCPFFIFLFPKLINRRPVSLADWLVDSYHFLDICATAPCQCYFFFPSP